MRKIIDPVTGLKFDAPSSLKVSPLFYEKKPVIDGLGVHKMDDEWMYVNARGYGSIAINVNRATYAKKIYLSGVKIIDSLSGKKASARLNAFIEKVGDTLVFNHKGISYRVELQKTNNGVDLLNVYPFWAMNNTGGIMPTWGANIKKYGPKAARGGWMVDLKETFGFDFN